MTIDVTDATFQVEVLDRSNSVTVIVDLWAPWCEPCKTLGPILEKHCDATNGQVVLAKVNVDENPSISMAFQVQSIPAVFIMQNGSVLDGFVGMKPEHVIKELIESLLPGGEAALQPAVVEEVVVEPEPFVVNDEFDSELAILLPQVKTDEHAKTRYLEILEMMGADDPRTVGHRRKLTAQLF
jgi:putative thioredoxin